VRLGRIAIDGASFLPNVPPHSHWPSARFVEEVALRFIAANDSRLDRGGVAIESALLA
jgi:hypothetical protein